MHTKGSWKVGEEFRGNDGSFAVVSEENGEHIGHIGFVTFHGTAKRGQAWCTPDPEGLANARLIAAAPDLLAALKACEERMSSDGYHDDSVETARAAIAKAEGSNGTK